MTKRFFAALLCFALLMTLLPGTANAATAGPFAVTGGASPGDYAFTDGGSSGMRVLTVKTGTRLTVGMATTGASTTTDEGRIVIADGATAYLTLNSVEIGWGNVGPFSALTLGAGSTLHLTIEGNNSLEGSSDACGIRVPTDATLNIAGSGVLRATGTGRGAGIGGGGGYGGNGGDGATVVITGGTVYATGCQGNSGAGGSIGGGMWTDSGTGGTYTPGAPGTVKNSSDNVYLTTLTLDGAGDVPVGDFTTKPGYFGMTGVRTLSSKLYFYLPVNTAVSAVQTGGTSPQEYLSGATAIQTNASGTAAGTLTLPVAPSITVTPAARFAQGGARLQT